LEIILLNLKKENGKKKVVIEFEGDFEEFDKDLIDLITMETNYIMKSDKYK
jgi:hypothetical protein